MCQPSGDEAVGDEAAGEEAGDVAGDAGATATDPGAGLGGDEADALMII